MATVIFRSFIIYLLQMICAYFTLQEIGYAVLRPTVGFIYRPNSSILVIVRA